LFEGVLRKWLLPGLSSAIYFIKDPIVLYYLLVNFHYFCLPIQQLKD